MTTKTKKPAKAKTAKGAKGAKAKTAKTAKVAKTAKATNGNSKLAICAALLSRKEGCTTRELLDATSWPAIGVPATARAAKLKLRKEKVKGSPTRYFGTPLANA